MLSASSLRLTLAMVAASALLPCITLAQPQESTSPQDQSVAEAARKAREKKKKAEKPPRVIDEDALKPSPGPTNAPDLQTAKASVPTVRGEEATVPTAAPKPEAAAGDQKEEAKRLAADVAKAKEKLADLQKQEDLLERQLTLDKDTVYSNPDYANDTAGLAKLDALLQQIKDKQQEVSDAKAHLAELQSKLDQVAPSEAPAQPAPPQP
jgi:DNA repair exonuclease SbcCD ATPase subunit